MTAEYECEWQDYGGYIVGSHEPYAEDDYYKRNSGYWSMMVDWELAYGGNQFVNNRDEEKKGQAGKKYHVKFCNVKGQTAYLDVDGERYYSIPNNQNDISLTNVYLFANQFVVSRNGVPTRAKVYYVKIWDKNGTLVRYYVPYINENNQVGMIDKVENKFYGNDGVGEFLTSEKILSASDMNAENNDQMFLANWKHNSFLEYIEGTGTQYIDTGEHAGENGMTAEYEATWTTSSGGCIVGSHNVSYPYGRNSGFWFGTQIGWQLGYGEECPCVSGGAVGVRYHVKYSTLYSDAWLEVDGTRLISSSN